ncbi:histidine kinase [Corallococcus sp. H22C18031201]|uniref:sensor histidine kinase n=1 Tax=Citreicoccus inhibens TaxID=2849499 RepID=UPI000E72428C|nr:ATP-binding protein [Citreicoccus inhibens]MBU8896222.1 histidine kinase [Citreicoccus inhibens]RJS26088.1 histidine kinase [Corallococcus sp. H22C18031201]
MAPVSVPPAEYRLLEGLPLPAAVVREAGVVYVNPALAQLLGPGARPPSTPTELLTRLLAPGQGPVDPARAPLSPEPPLWLRVRAAREPEHVRGLRRLPGITPAEHVLLWLDAEGEDAVLRLSEALAMAASEMLRCRDEHAVLELAAEAVHRQGFHVSFMLLDGESLRHGPMRQDADTVAAAERLYGKAMSEVRFPRASMPHLEAVLAQRRALFHPDLFEVVRRLHAPEVASLIVRTYPPGTRGLDAPIFVGGKPYGIFSAQGLMLTPAGAGTLELFAQLVGGALENVRHHRDTEARLAELSRLQEELVARERLTVLGEAAGVVAHEVRNPLGAILNAVAVLKREARLGTAGISAVEMLEEEAIRLEDIVRDLLDVVRPLEPRPRPLHLGELVRRALGLLRERPGAASPPVDVREDEDLPLLQADETLLQLAVTHLLRNALQAAPEPGAVRVRVTRVPEGVSLSVEDTGAGIPGVDPQRVFEPFFLTRANGRGLGLAIVRRVVLAHGGQVRAGTRPEGGARFELVLPLEPRA